MGSSTKDDISEKFIVRSTMEAAPFERTNLHSYLTVNWHQNLDKEAWVNTTTGRRLTYRQLRDAVDRLSREMTSAGVCRGKVVSIWCFNCLEMQLVQLAAWRLEAVPSLISPSLTVDEARRQVSMVKSQFLFADEQHAADAISSIFSAADDKVQVAFDFDGYKMIKILHSRHVTSDFNIHGTDTFDPDNDTAVILTSSGTTGLPKAVQLTHTNMTCSFLLSRARSADNQKIPPVLQYLPMSHIYGLKTSLVALRDCSVVYFLPRFNLDTYCSLVAQHKVTLLHLVPPIAVMLTKRPDLVEKRDLTCVKEIYCSSAPLPVDVKVALGKLLPGLTTTAVRHAFGMTELAGAVTSSRTASGQTPVDGSVGVMLPYHEMKVVDEKTGAPCGPNQPGELFFRGPLVMKGYYGNPEATKATIDHAGWLRTGDIGYFDNNYNIYIIDRVKELIKYKGLQVAPAELENVILSHPDVEDAAVVGLPDQLAGELPLAFVVKRPNSSVTEQDIQKFVAERVAVFKRLTGGVRFIDKIPKLESGKILRRHLRDSLRDSLSAPKHKL